MGKRSMDRFVRVERDFYPTPFEAFKPLIPFLKNETFFWEPCAGDGRLADYIVGHAGLVCLGRYDIEPQHESVCKADALVTRWPCLGVSITNPPWRRDILHPLIERLTENGGRAWLLFDADWIHTKQAVPYLPRLRKIVSVGRVKWIPDSKMTGKDNCAWHYFTAPSGEPTQFFGRTA